MTDRGHFNDEKKIFELLVRIFRSPELMVKLSEKHASDQCVRRLVNLVVCWDIQKKARFSQLTGPDYSPKMNYYSYETRYNAPAVSQNSTYYPDNELFAICKACGAVIKEDETGNHTSFCSATNEQKSRVGSKIFGNDISDYRFNV